MDLSKMTQLELLELRKKVNDEIDGYGNRNKTKVFTVFIAFIGTRYFLKKENAINYLKECIEEDMLFDGNEAKCGEKFLNDAEIEQNCEDFNRS